MPDKINSDYYSNLTYVREHLSEPVILDQFAEECNELSHALMKKARKLREENPTPKSIEEIDKAIEEEFADIWVCARVINMQANLNISFEKLARWADRIKFANEENIDG